MKQNLTRPLGALPKFAVSECSRRSMESATTRNAVDVVVEMTDDLKQRHMNYLRRKTADESELWAAERIEQLEAERDQLSEQVKMLRGERIGAWRRSEALRDQVKMLHKTLSGLVKAIDAAEYSTQFQMNLRIAEEALTATEPRL